MALWGLGIFCHGIFGFNLQWTIIVIGAIVVVYATTGGSWAVMGTDFLQDMGTWLTIAGIRYGKAHPKELLGLDKGETEPSRDGTEKDHNLKV